MSKIRKIFFGNVVENRLKLKERDIFDQVLKNLNGQEVEMSIGKRIRRRSGQQNKYYWGVVVKILSDELGLDMEEMHEALKIKFLRLEKKTKNEKVVILVSARSTSDLDTAEFEDYTDQIRRWAAVEMNTVIPLPNEVDYDKIQLYEVKEKVGYKIKAGDNSELSSG